MLELYQAAVSPPNLFFTVLLALVVLYWVLYLVGALGEEALDFFGLDLGADADMDVDVPADIHVPTDFDVPTDVGADLHADVHADLHGDVHGDVGGAGPGALASFLHFFHVGQIPVAIIFSILVVAMWVLSITANELLGNSSLLLGVALFLPIFVVGLMVTKAILTPFAPLLKKIFDTSGDKVEILGRRCTVVSLEATPKCGQAEVETPGAPILLNVMTRDGITLRRGDEAVVYDYDQEKHVYLIAAFDANQTSAREN